MSIFKLLLDPMKIYRKRYAVLQMLREIPANVRQFFRYWGYRCRLLTVSEFSDLDELKDKYIGKKAFLIGNGPSVRVDELDLINSSEFVTFCANRIHLAYPDMDFRPTFVVSADLQMITDFGQEILDSNSGSVCFVSKMKPKFSGSFFWFFLSKRLSLKFSTNVYKDVTLSGGTLFAAMQIGYHMGIREFFLYGVDHNFKYEERVAVAADGDAVGDGNHFIKGYRSGKSWFAPRYELVESGFQQADKFLRGQGGCIVNATNGGRLEVLERKSLEDVLKDVGND